MPKPLIESEVIKNKKLNYKFNLVQLRFVDQFPNFLPGQYVSLKVSNSISRYYSIFSSSTDLPYWSILVDITPGGPGTIYIKSLKKGGIIKTSKALGKFTLNKSQSENVIFGATGCGIAPLKPMIEKLLSSQNKKIFLLWGLRLKRDIVLKELLDKWVKTHPNFSYNITLSKPEKTWSGKKGHINSHLIKVVKKLQVKKTSVYLTGNTGFIKNVLDGLEKIKFPVEKIYFESYCTPL